MADFCETFQILLRNYDLAFRRKFQIKTQPADSADCVYKNVVKIGFERLKLIAFNACDFGATNSV